MGFFSQLCNRCQHPLLCPHATTRGVNEWMSQVVAITPNGSILRGTYDGYGAVDRFEMVVGDDSTVFHEACWEVAGKPSEYTGASAHAKDQGWFFDDGAHDLPDPRGPQPQPAGPAPG